MFFFSFLSSFQKNSPRLITCVASVFVQRAFSALRILAARKMDEASANISTKMSICGVGEEIFALVPVCTWPECREPGKLWVQGVQQREAALRYLFEIMVNNRPGPSGQANYWKVIGEFLFYNVFLIYSSHFYWNLYGRGEHTPKELRSRLVKKTISSCEKSGLL